jgi:hypothetical protein
MATGTLDKAGGAFDKAKKVAPFLGGGNGSSGEPMINRIILDKYKGMTLEVVNGEQIQRITLDGTKMTLTVMDGPDQKSTIVQTADSVTINADMFKVKSMMVEISADIDISLESGMSIPPTSIGKSSISIDPFGVSVDGAQVEIGGGATGTISIAPGGALAVAGVAANIGKLAAKVASVPRMSAKNKAKLTSTLTKAEAKVAKAATKIPCSVDIAANEIELKAPDPIPPALPICNIKIGGQGAAIELVGIPIGYIPD